MPRREGGITQAGFSVVEYERWMEEHDPAILDAIAAYNRDDCISNLLLRDWLEARRVEAIETHPEWYPDGSVPRPLPEDGAAPPKVAEEQAQTRAREEALRAAVPVDRTARTDEEQGRWLLAALLDWHRREAKPQWWDHFRLVEAPLEVLLSDSAALAELRFEEDLGRIDKSALHQYRFDPAQDSKVVEGKSYLALAPKAHSSDWDQSTVKVIALDPVAGTIRLKRNAGNPHPVALIPTTPYGTEPMRSALGRLADYVVANGVEGPGRYRAARDLILRAPPRISGLGGGAPLPPDGGDMTPIARDLALRLDETVLAIQGPPGTGKTYTAARMILDLVDAGKRVGVTAQSHRVIANLLEAVQRAAAAERRFVRIGQRYDGDDDAGNGFGIERIAKSDDVAPGLARRAWDVVGGTSWLWAREDLEEALDVLFVDEAGQVSLATVCAVACAARSVVLLGDPNQLPQVSQGTHPEGAAASALEHLVGDAKTIAPDRGLLLGTTYRLHPDVNAFVSDAFYEGRLATAPPNALQRIEDGEPVGGTGIRHVAIRTTGASNRSRDEAAWIADAIATLRGRRWINERGEERALEVDDVIVVAPYNAQVAEIGRAVKDRIGIDANVGTVDKFQGREGAVAIYSMTTSTPEDAPRDLEFLYSGNRLNVAVSRARALAVVIANPALFRVACHTPEQMRLLNAFCRLLEVADAQQPRTAAAASRIATRAPGEDPPLLLFPELGPQERRRTGTG
jgi:uncharacterized protein